MPDQPGQELGHIGSYDHLVMNGAECRRHLSRKGEFVVGTLEADRERLDWLARHAAHDCHDQTRIEPSAQQRANRNVSLEPLADGLVETLIELRQPIVFGPALW